MKNPDPVFGRVAVITRTRERPLMLRRAIESVLGQSYAEWVHVIVNDGGDPAPVNLLAAEYAAAYRGRLQILHNPCSTGMQNASNQAIRASSSDYIVIHDDDDSWAPAFLETCVNYLEQRGAEDPVQGVVANTVWIFEEIDGHGNIVERWRADFPACETIRLADVAGENRFPPIAFLYRRRAHEAVGYFNEHFTVLGDWDFNLRFLMRYDIGVVSERLARWHWRTQCGASAYGNSSTAGLAVHKEMNARLFNHYMRQDLETGRMGLGFLMNVSHSITLLSKRVDALKAQNEPTARRFPRYIKALAQTAAYLWALARLPLKNIAARRKRRRAAAGRQPAPVSDAEDRGALLRAVTSLQPGDLLSVDVFDTALLRLLRQPTDLFAFIEPAVRRLPGGAGAPFAMARVAAERIARQRHVGGACEDVTFAQIYDVLAGLDGFSRSLADAAMRMELDAERRLCYASPVVLDAVRAARARDVRVVFVSDMYLPAEFIASLLETGGYAAPEVLVSCTQGHTKHSGNLFRDLLDATHCPPGRVLHVGDHPVSDHQRPAAMGLRTLHLTRERLGWTALADQQFALGSAASGEALSSLCTGLARRRLAQQAGGADIWDRLGYELSGPLMFAFSRWIADQAAAQGVRKLFFLSRDGYQLEQIFRACADRWNLPIESAYLYASRRLLNLARIERMDDAALGFLMTADAFLSVRDFLERIGLDADPLAADARRAGFSGLDEEITVAGGHFRSPGHQARLRQLLLAVAPQILAIAQAERANVTAYFDDVGFVPGPVAIVDLGWQASSLRSLQDLLRLRQPDFRLRGFYFGTWTAAAPVVEAGCELASFFFHLGQPQPRAALLAECVELIEHLFTAPHATVVSLARDAQGWRPVCGAWETTPQQRQALGRVSAAAAAFVQDLLAVVPTMKEHDRLPFGYLETVLERVLRHPTRAEAEALGELPHRSSFGGNAPCRHLARPPAMARAFLRPRALREAFGRAYWRAGFRARLGPLERTLIGG